MTTLLADLVIRNGRIWPGIADPTSGAASTVLATALAVRDGSILAAGTEADIEPLAACAARVVDLQGRLVLPGLQDSHIHAVRAGLTWDREMHWEGVESVADALDLLRARVATAGPGQWICAVGGWHARQFAERRAPTRAELDGAAPDHPVLTQMLYESATLNSRALADCGWMRGCADPPGGTVERDRATGEPTGVIRGMGAFRVAIDRAAPPSDAEQLSGTRRMLADFAAHGITAVVDGGGLFMTPESYRPAFRLWRDGALPVRMRLFVSASSAGSEIDDLTQWMRRGVPGFGDQMMRVCGLGEVVHLGCHDLEGFGDFAIGDADLGEFAVISARAAAAGWPMSMHAVLDYTLGKVLDTWERVASGVDLRPLRWSIVHADQASPGNIERMAALGLGVLVQDRMVLQGPDYAELWGADQIARTPPLGELRAAGLPVAGGSDATRASRYLPWWSIWWLVAGSDIDRGGTRGDAHRMSVADALDAYSHAGTWFTFEEGQRGRLAPGYDADFFVPTADPFAIPVDDLPAVRSSWTVVGGRSAHSDGTVIGDVDSGRPTGTPGQERAANHRRRTWRRNV